MTDIKMESDKLHKLRKIKLAKDKLAKSEIVSQGPVDEVESGLIDNGGDNDEVDFNLEVSRTSLLDSNNNVRGYVSIAVNEKYRERKSKGKDHHIQLRIPAQYGVMYKELTMQMKKALKDVYIEALRELHRGV